MTKSLTIESDDFEYEPFVQRGGLGKAYQTGGDVTVKRTIPHILWPRANASFQFFHTRCKGRGMEWLSSDYGVLKLEMGTKAGRFLRFRVQRHLQLLYTCGGY
jgi:hypothetical protein